MLLFTVMSLPAVGAFKDTLTSDLCGNDKLEGSQAEMV